MKLLFLAYYFPPIRAVGAQRLYQLHQHSRPFFEDIHVITTDNRHRFPQDPGLALPEAKIIEIPTFDLRTQLSSQGQSGVHLDFRTKSTPWGRWLRRLYHSYPFWLWVGDGGRGYRKAGLREAIRLVQEEGITHIISSFRPWADHWIAGQLKKRFPHLHWTADFRDLPVDAMRRDVWWPALQRWQMRRMIKQADRLLTVSEGLAESLRVYHPKVEVVLNGLDGVANRFMTAPFTASFTLTYTGSLYPELQSVGLLFRNLRQMLNENLINPVQLQLQYAGKDRELWRAWTRQHGMGHLSIDFGETDLRTARELQGESQMNLLLSWSGPETKGVLTAKLGDYLKAGRPIIALQNGPADPELKALVEESGAGRLFAADTENAAGELQQFLLDAYRTWSFSGALPWRVEPDFLEPYAWQQQVAGLWQQT